MEKKIIELIRNNRSEFWDNISEVDYEPMTDKESKASNMCDEELAKQIIKLFK